MSFFAGPVDCYADVLEFDEVSDELAVLTLRRALRLAAREGSLIAALSDAREPFWRALSDALEVMALEQLPAR